MEDHVDGKEKLNVMLAKKKRSSLKRMQTRLLLRKNKAQIKVAQRSGVLRKIKIFEGLTPDQLAKFIRMTKLETLKKGDGEYLSEESEHRVMESTVVEISIHPLSFKLISLSLPRSPLSKTPKQVFFLTL